MGDGSPFYHPHTLGKGSVYIDYAAIEQNFEPKRALKSGVVVADLKNHVVGLCVKYGRVARKKGIYCTLKGVTAKGRNKHCAAKDCVAVPAPNEFIRHATTKKWYCMFRAGPKLAEVLPVLVKTDADDAASNNAEETGCVFVDLQL